VSGQKCKTPTLSQHGERVAILKKKYSTERQINRQQTSIAVRQ